MTETAVAKKPTGIQDLIMNHQRDFDKVLPSQIGVERFVRVCTSALSTNPKLMKCTPVSLMGSIMQAAQLGLEPNTPLGLAYLIPYKTACKLIIGYKGMINLAYQSEKVLTIISHVVYKNEEFDITYGTDEKITHKPIQAKADRGAAIGAYCIVKLKDGGYIQRYLSKDEINDARPKYEANDSPWKSYWDEMALKTVLRRTLKHAPMAAESKSDQRLARAIEADEVHDRGGSYHFEVDDPQNPVIDIIPEEPSKPAKVQKKDKKKDKKKDDKPTTGKVQEFITEQQGDDLYALSQESGYDDAQYETLVTETFGFKSTEDITVDKWEAILAAAGKKPNA